MAQSTDVHEQKKTFDNQTIQQTNNHINKCWLIVKVMSSGRNSLILRSGIFASTSHQYRRRRRRRHYQQLMDQ